MSKDEQLKQIIKNLYDGLDSAALIFTNQDGSLNVVREEQSSYTFLVYNKECEFNVLLNKFKEQGYLVDLDIFKGLIPARDLIKVDVINKTVTRPLIVSVNHYLYLREKASILLSDAIDAFDEIVINQNKELLESFIQKRQK